MSIEPQKLEASAIVLAGGKSSRMGRPKALLPFAGEPLLLHITRVLGGWFSDVVVVAAPGQQLPSLPVRLVHDVIAHQGPTGGLYYGLQAAANEVSFVCSCDLPFLNFSLIAHLASRLSGYDAVVPEWENRLQPLHALYRKSVVPLLQEQLNRGELRVSDFCEKARTRIVTTDELRQFDPEGSSFFNLNTPEDYQKALARWLERSR